ncbi:MAG: TolC family protein [Cytophagales bacterium]|nr:TolC family protein [Cytophagales bacterium]
MNSFIKLLAFLALFIAVHFGNAQGKIWTLQECVNLAMDKNIQVLQSKWNNETNKINANQLSYNRLPSVSGRATQGVNFGRSVDPFTNQYLQQTVYSNNFSLNANYVIFNGFQNTNSIQQNELNYMAGQFDLQKTKNDIALNVISAYLQILVGYEQLEAAKLQIGNTEAQVDRTQKLVNAGSTPELALLQLKSQLQTDRLNMVNIQNNLQVAKLNLQQFMMEPLSENFEIERIQVPEVDGTDYNPSSENIYSISLENQPQIQAVKYRVLGAMKGVAVSKGTLYPQLILTGAIGTLYSSSAKSIVGQVATGKTDTLAFVSGIPVTRPNTVTQTELTPFGKQLENNTFQNVNLVLNIPIFNNFQSRAAIQRAKINQKLAELNGENVKFQLRRDVEQATVKLKNARARLLSSQQQVEALKLSFSFAEKRFNAGALNTTDYTVEKNNLSRAMFDYSQARYEFVFRKKILDFYEGKPIF